MLATALLFASKLFASLDLPVHQIVAGDADATHSARRAGMLRVHHQDPVDAVLLVGDNVYP